MRLPASRDGSTRTDLAGAPVPPRQARSRRTLERIVEGALALLAEGGAEGLTVQAVVERARASVGSFYARFGGKEELLLHLEDRVWSEVRQRWDEGAVRLSEQDLALASVIAELVRLLRDVRQVRARERKALAAREGSRRRERAFHARAGRVVREQLLARAREIAHPDPALAADVGFAAVVGAMELEEMLAREEKREARATDDRFSDELARLWVAYLAGAEGEPRRRRPDSVDFFDVWG